MVSSNLSLKDLGLEESFENGDRLSGSFRSNDEVRRLNIDNQIRAAFLMRNKMDLGIAQSSFLAGILLMMGARNLGNFGA
jgi:hypothetical protein